MNPFEKAEELAKNGAFEDALEHYNQAIYQNAMNPVMVSQRAVCFYHLKKLDQALEDMNTAVKLDPGYSYRYSSRAYIKDAMGDVKGAIEDYKRAIDLDPSDAVSYNNLGMLEEKLGYIEASKKNFKKADELAKILEETGIVTEDELKGTAENSPQNIQREIDSEEAERSSSSVFNEIKKVFTSKDSLKDFISFVKNGFRNRN